MPRIVTFLMLFVLSTAMLTAACESGAEEEGGQGERQEQVIQEGEDEQQGEGVEEGEDEQEGEGFNEDNEDEEGRYNLPSNAILAALIAGGTSS